MGVRKYGAEEDIWASERERDRETGYNKSLQKLHKQECNDLQDSSPNITAIEKIEEDEMDKDFGMHGAVEKCILGLVNTPEERRPLGKSRHTWEENVKMHRNNREMGGYGLFHLAEDSDQVAGSCEHRNEPSSSIQCGEFLGYLRSNLLRKTNSAAWSRVGPPNILSYRPSTPLIGPCCQTYAHHSCPCSTF